MIICEHVIQKDQIIGIGPLMLQNHPEQSMRMLYNSKQLFFFLHLKNHSVKIESDWFQVGTGTNPRDCENRERERYEEFTKSYKVAKNIVIDVVYDDEKIKPGHRVK